MPTGVELPRLELVLFGAPTVRLDGREPPGDVLWRKHVALLAHLALSPGYSRSRDYFMGLLWPDKPQANARHSLNEAVRRLRAGLGSDRLVSHGDTIQLVDTALEVDVTRFDRLAKTDAAAALELVRGDFLEGFIVEDAPGFEDWASQLRRRYRTEVSELLLARGEADLASNRFVEAQEAARRALRMSRFSEPAANLLMRSSALAGDSSGALVSYREFEDRLLTEISEQPGRELKALAARIRSGKWRQAARKYAELEPALVGRRAEHERAFYTVDEAMRAGPTCLVIMGDPGMGKTRLIDECIERSALAGAMVALARPLESDHDAPWSTLRLLMRDGLAGAPGAAAADPRALSVLASLVPELAERFEPTQPKDAADVAGALRSLLEAISEEQAMVVAVDDADSADGLTIAAVGAAVRELSGRCPIALVISANPTAESGASAELIRLRSEVGRGLPGAVVHLHPLPRDDVHELVTRLAPWCKSAEDIDRLSRRIGFESGGSPFLAVTLLRSLERAPTLKEDLLHWPAPGSTFDSPLPFSVPDLVRIAIVARVSDLDEDSINVLRAASIGAIALDLDLIESLTEMPRKRIDEALDVLERRQLLTFDGTRYAFAAPLLEQVVRTECLTRGQRQRMRHQAMKRLIEREDIESRVLRVELCAKADPSDAATQEALEVAHSALEAGSDRTARRALAAAERMGRAGHRGDASKIEELRSRLARS
jgi:DNA-binding SARP family transcriptional activator